MNDETGKAFYLYMLERDVSNFKSQKYPPTRKKKEYIAELMPPVHKFIKFNYLLSKKEIKRVSTKEIFNNYLVYCANNDIKECTQRKFNDAMRELNFKYISSNSKTFYNITLKQLEDIAAARGWLTELDADDFEKQVIWKDMKTVACVAGHNNNMFEAKEYEDIIDEKEKVINEQLKQIDELKKQLETLTKKKEKKEKKEKKVIKKKSSPKLIIGDSNNALSAFLDM